jgi:hypothetical protein
MYHFFIAMILIIIGGCIMNFYHGFAWLGLIILGIGMIYGIALGGTDELK